MAVVDQSTPDPGKDFDKRFKEAMENLRVRMEAAQAAEEQGKGQEGPAPMAPPSVPPTPVQPPRSKPKPITAYEDAKAGRRERAGEAKAARQGRGMLGKPRTPKQAARQQQVQRAQQQQQQRYQDQLAAVSEEAKKQEEERRKREQAKAPEEARPGPAPMPLPPDREREDRLGRQEAANRTAGLGEGGAGASGTEQRLDTMIRILQQIKDAIDKINNGVGP